MTEILELANYKVLTATDGRQGVEAAITHQPDLIVCDIMMPVLDGYGVLYAVQQNPLTRHTPFIFLTAKAERAEMRKGMELGADDYITKPFDSLELLNSISVRLRKKELLQDTFSSDLHGFHALMSASNGRDMLAELKDDRNVDQYKKKQIIYTEGNHPTRLYYILKGKVKTFKRNDDGKELIIGLYNEGDFLGYTALLESRTYSEQAEALEETELAVIPREDFDHLIHSNLQVMEKFVQLLARNVAEKEKQLLGIAYNSLRKKVAEALLQLHNKYNPHKHEHFVIDISRDNLAAVAGVAKESLIRTLGDFHQEKLVELKEGKISLLQLKKLEFMLN